RHGLCAGGCDRARVTSRHILSWGCLCRLAIPVGEWPALVSGGGLDLRIATASRPVARPVRPVWHCWLGVDPERLRRTRLHLASCQQPEVRDSHHGPGPRQPMMTCLIMMPLGDGLKWSRRVAKV